jgi:hypothetical protein
VQVEIEKIMIGRKERQNERKGGLNNKSKKSVLLNKTML